MAGGVVDKALAAKIAVSVVIYGISVSLVPIYNKKVFSGEICWSGGCAKSFPFPITTAFLQLGVVALALIAANIVCHFCSPRLRSGGNSWIFGPHFGYKLRHIAPVGVLFGIKYGITNWGLALVPTAQHLLLQSTDFVWTVLFARIFNKERLGFLEGVAVVITVVGAVFISISAGASMDAPALGLAVNLLTPIFLALCITTLRSGAAEIFRPDNCLGGSMTPFEFTAIKLALSSSVAFVLAFILENAAVQESEGAKHAESWWIALESFPPQSLGLVLAGGFLILIFQVNITWLAGMTSATAVGLVGEVKVLPQLLLNALFSLKVDLSPMSLLGAAFSVMGSILYASSSVQLKRLLLTRQGFRWVSRAGVEEKLTESLASSQAENASSDRVMESGQAIQA